MLINNINFKYGSNEIYNNFNIEFQQGKVNCIIGESGCGKTTLLNYISEKIYYENKRIAYVFQEDNLIPWKNIYVNLKIVAKKYFEKSILEKEINNALVKVRLEKYKYFYPRELSGGMRQRINFARALIGNPEVILMDEPFKSLDIKSKNNMIELIKNLKNTDITIILVTHDINEILMLADVVYYLGGRPVEIIESAIGINIKNIIKKINKPIDDLE
ncbi:MAG: ATP-binding cassette domain-containing protein [Clostridium sp.]|uniref:ATP-binding cassette domain-containing protein n=1 Tax=Clostridium sp. TaxID=1506 RepID=UPI00399B29FA